MVSYLEFTVADNSLAAKNISLPDFTEHNTLAFVTFSLDQLQFTDIPTLVQDFPSQIGLPYKTDSRRSFAILVLS